MTETTAPASNLWSTLTTLVTTLAPSLNTVVSALAGIALGVGGLATWQGATAPKLVLQAADKPRAEPPEPIRIVLQPLDRLESRISDLEGKIDALTKLAMDRLPAAKVVAPSRKTARVR